MSSSHFEVPTTVPSAAFARISAAVYPLTGFGDPHGECACADRLQQPAPGDWCHGHVAPLCAGIFAPFPRQSRRDFARLKASRAPSLCSRRAPLAAVALPALRASRHVSREPISEKMQTL